MRIRVHRSSAALILLAALAGCIGEVSGPVLGKIAISPDPVPALGLGRTLLLVATIFDPNGERMPGVAVRWQADIPGIVRFVSTNANSAYLVGQNPGTTTVTARFGSTTSSIVVTVSPPGPLAIIDIGPKTSSLHVGASSQIGVELRDVNAARLQLPLSFTSSDPAVASVTNTGLVTAVSEGVANVTVVAGGMSATQVVTVLPGGRAFRWTPASGMTSLGVLPGFQESFATAVSSTGLVVGGLVNAVGDTSAFLWSEQRGMKLLAPLPGSGASNATGVNASGVVVGYAVTSGNLQHAVIWDATGAIRELSPPGTRSSSATGINDAGQVVGQSDVRGWNAPFIWSSSEGLALLKAPGIAWAINAAGQVVGEASNAPFVWNARDSVRWLPIPAGENGGAAVAISNSGVIAGRTGSDYCRFYDDDFCSMDIEHPAYWPDESTVVDLRPHPDLRARGVTLRGVNAAGQFVGGSSATGRAFVWTAAKGYQDLGTLPGRNNSIATALNDSGVIVGRSYAP